MSTSIFPTIELKALDRLGKFKQWKAPPLFAYEVIWFISPIQTSLVF